jgi:hypothetical protein
MVKHVMFIALAWFALSPVVCGADVKKSGNINFGKAAATINMKSLPFIKAPDIFQKTDGATKEIPRANGKTSRHMPDYDKAMARSIKAAQKYLRYSSNFNKIPEITATANMIYHARVDYPKEGKDFLFCREGVLGYVYMGSSVIQVCAIMLDSFDEKAIAQNIIHEAAHVAGYRNECVATAVEIMVMRDATGSLAYENDYMADCGLH